jgi:hypothetical protein
VSERREERREKTQTDKQTDKQANTCKLTQTIANTEPGERRDFLVRPPPGDCRCSHASSDLQVRVFVCLLLICCCCLFACCCLPACCCFSCRFAFFSFSLPAAPCFSLCCSRSRAVSFRSLTCTPPLHHHCRVAYKWVYPTLSEYARQKALSFEEPFKPMYCHGKVSGL